MTFSHPKDKILTPSYTHLLARLLEKHPGTLLGLCLAGFLSLECPSLLNSSSLPFVNTHFKHHPLYSLWGPAVLGQAAPPRYWDSCCKAEVLGSGHVLLHCVLLSTSSMLMVLSLLWHLWSVLSHVIWGSEILFYVVYNVTCSPFKKYVLCTQKDQGGKEFHWTRSWRCVGVGGHKIKLWYIQNPWRVLVSKSREIGLDGRTAKWFCPLMPLMVYPAFVELLYGWLASWALKPSMWFAV